MTGMLECKESSITVEEKLIVTNTFFKTLLMLFLVNSKFVNVFLRSLKHLFAEGCGFIRKSKL